MATTSAKENLFISPLKEGNRSAFDEIFKTCWEFVDLSAYKRLRDEDAAKDIAQELFISLWERRESLEIENLATWFYTSVRFRVINHLKSADTDLRYQEQLAKLTDEHYICHAMSEYDTAILLDYATKELTDRTRQIFEMSRLQQKTIEEIANELQLSDQTVKNQLSSALKVVRKKLNYVSLHRGKLHFFSDQTHYAGRSKGRGIDQP